MKSAEALATALGMLSCPQMTRPARLSSLPKGVTFLLEVAAGDSEALQDASELTGRTEANLRKAAGFFIEQVLLSEHAVNYRVLGGSCETSHSDLRRHMALIMRWLHPDVVSSSVQAQRFDRGLYAERVTKAWESIKSKERRAAYDALLASGTREQGTEPNGGPRYMLGPRVVSKPAAIGRRRRKKQNVLTPPRRNGFWSRVLLLFAGRS